MKRAFIIVPLLTVLFSPALPAAQGQKKEFDVEAAMEHVRTLSADIMQGRESGDPGGDRAGEYIISKLRNWGLEPGGPQGMFYQDMTFEYIKKQRGAILDVAAENGKRSYVCEEDWCPYKYSGSGSLTAPVVFAGYGISAPARGYDDYGPVDVRNKIVLFAAEVPRKMSGLYEEEASLASRVKAARDHGAAGVLTFQPENRPGNCWQEFIPGLDRGVYKPDFMIVALETKVVRYIFKRQGTELRHLLRRIDALNKPQSLELKARVIIDLKMVNVEKRPARNILARITGSDPRLRNEYVILGAHMDHLGVDFSGDIFNGADDNATGTAVVLETARRMALHGPRPKRTVVFALWAAEEKGLLGSKYYNDAPCYPLAGTRAYVNLDMLGEGTGQVEFRGASNYPGIWALLKERLPEGIISGVIPSRGIPGGSDHTHFMNNGVPAFHARSAGPHMKTNRVGDVPGLVDPAVLKKSGEFIVSVMDVLGGEARIPAIKDPRGSFHLENAVLVNYVPVTMDGLPADHGKNDPQVDVQMLEPAAMKDAAADFDQPMKACRLRKDLAKTQAYSLYMNGSAAWQPGLGKGRTVLIQGLKWDPAVSYDPYWLDIMAREGTAYARIDDPAWMIEGDHMSRRGKEILNDMKYSGILPVVKTADLNCLRIILEECPAPVFAESYAVPDPVTAELVRNSSSCYGLILKKDSAAAEYCRALGKAGEVLTAGRLAIVPEDSILEEAGKRRMMALINELLDAHYDPKEMDDLFSGAWLKILAGTEPEGTAPAAMFYSF